MTPEEVLVDSLDWGVRVVFGLPGDGINGILEAQQTRQKRIHFIQVRHEETAAFIASAYANSPGDKEFVWLLQRPGGIHFAEWFVRAKRDGQPRMRPELAGNTPRDKAQGHRRPTLHATE